MSKTVLVTGGCGFIGSAVMHDLISASDHVVVNVDKMTYAANPLSVSCFADNPRYRFEKADICDAAALRSIFRRHDPSLVMHLAAESHVDRSIDGPGEFVQTNVTGTFCLLEAAREHFDQLSAVRRSAFRFLHVSTDEVFGSLGPDGEFFEVTPYSPRSPYSATKASSDHLVRAWGETYGLPILVSNCSNNYGPRQFPEKLIPLVILKALSGDPLPVYGKGENVRDWLFVEDHAAALRRILIQGAPGESYNVGGRAERRNIDLVELLCGTLDGLRPRDDRRSYAEQITFVSDRPGHDLRYAMNIDKIERELGWSPEVSFEQGLARTVRWYLDNEVWWRPILERGNLIDRRGLGLACGAA
jgi:dTDP-glucose 4,6-dehydratase